jgi:hypothetical protein
MKIDYNTPAESQYKQKRKQKINALNGAKSLCEKYFKIEDEKEFQKGFSKYAISILKKKIGLPYIDENKLFELTDFPITKLQIFEATFKRNTIDLLSPEPDFSIYATNDKQIETFKKLQSLCDNLNEWKPQNTFWIERALGGKIQNAGKGFKPNTYYIKSL